MSPDRERKCEEEEREMRERGGKLAEGCMGMSCSMGAPCQITGRGN